MSTMWLVMAVQLHIHILIGANIFYCSLSYYMLDLDNKVGESVEHFALFYFLFILQKTLGLDR